MRIATFNIQNIFHRDLSLVKRTWRKSIKLWRKEFDRLNIKDLKMDGDYDRLRELGFLLGFHRVSSEPYVVMRRRAGLIFIRRNDSYGQAKANGFRNWDGWIRLGTTPIGEGAISNKARVITDVSPDILVLQEVEDKASVIDFNKAYLLDHNRSIFNEIHLLQGNDPRGLETALLLKNGYHLESVKSHCDRWKRNEEYLFEKDVQEYQIRIPGGRKNIYNFSSSIRKCPA